MRGSLLAGRPKTAANWTAARSLMNQKRPRVPPSGPWPVSARMAARCSFVASTTGSWSVRTIVCVADGTTRPRCTFGINENGRPFLMEMVISLLQLQTKACTTRVGCEIWKSTTWRNYTARPPRMEKTALGISGTIAEQGRFKLDAADSPRRSSSRFSETSAPRLARRARETSATALVASAGTCVASSREAETELLHISLAAQAVHNQQACSRHEGSEARNDEGGPGGRRTLTGTRQGALHRCGLPWPIRGGR